MNISRSMNGATATANSAAHHRRNLSSSNTGAEAGYDGSYPSPGSERKAFASAGAGSRSFFLGFSGAPTVPAAAALLRGTMYRLRLSFKKPLYPLVVLLGVILLAYTGLSPSTSSASSSSSSGSSGSSSRSRHASSSYSFRSFFASAPKVDIRAILGAVPPSHTAAGFAWTDGAHDHPLPFPNFMKFGGAAHIVELETSRIIETRTGEPMEGIGPHQPFNLGVIKLPKGSKWGFLGVARGPGKHMSNFVQVNGFWANEQSLIMMGLDIDSKGALTVAATPQTLDLPMIFRHACDGDGNVGHNFGPEDPRVFWTDAGTPALTFERFASKSNLCRDVGFIKDLRLFYPPLAEAMAVNAAEGIAEYDIKIEAGGSFDKEFIKLSGQNKVEKNWGAFYPGHTPDPLASIPHISYTLNPWLSIAPVSESPRSVSFADIPIDTSLAPAECVRHYHPRWPSYVFHQGTPWYRLTLCNRGCLADSGNTVFITMGHIENRPRYGKYFVTYNTTAPYNPISVGPRFAINALDEADTIVYGLTLVPLEPHDLDPSIPPIRTPRPYNPSHFFLDDQMLITFGHQDAVMGSSMMSVREAIGNQKFCADIEV